MTALDRGFQTRFFPHHEQATPQNQRLEALQGGRLVAQDDMGKVLKLPTATANQGFEGPLRPGWWVILWNTSSPATPAIITLKAPPSQLIDGLSGYPMYPGEARCFWVDDADRNLKSLILADGTFIDYTSTGDQVGIWPPGYSSAEVDIIGAGSGGFGGGGGASGTTNSTGGRSGGGGGGGGSGCSGQWTTLRIPYDSITPGNTFAYHNGDGGTGQSNGGLGGAGAVNATGATGNAPIGLPTAGGDTTFTYSIFTATALGGATGVGSGGGAGSAPSTGGLQGGGIAGARNTTNLGASDVTGFAHRYQNVNNTTNATKGGDLATGVTTGSDGGAGAPSGPVYIVGTVVTSVGGTGSAVLGTQGGDAVAPTQAPPGAGGAGGGGGGGSSGAVAAGTSGRGGNGAPGGKGGNGLTRVQFFR